MCACHCRILPGTAVGTRNSLKSRGTIQLLLLFFRLCYAVCCCCVPVSHRKLLMLWQPRNNSSRTSKYSFCEIYKRCWCTCVRIMWACHPQHIHVNEEQIPTRTWSEFQSIRVVQQRHNSNSSGTTLATLMYIERLCSPFSTCDTPGDFKSSTSRRRTLFVYDLI